MLLYGMRGQQLGREAAYSEQRVFCRNFNMSMKGRHVTSGTYFNYRM